jgi:hypothetical protein
MSSQMEFYKVLLHEYCLYCCYSGILGGAAFILRKFLQQDTCSEWKPTYNPTEHLTFCCHNNTNIHSNHHHNAPPKYTFEELHNFKNSDPFVIDTLDNRNYYRCEKIAVERENRWLPFMDVNSLGFESLDLDGNIAGTGCSNNSLNFYTISSRVSF